MTRHTQHHWLFAVLSALAFVVGVGAPASAGGWAVASLDEVPAATAGDTTDVGFTILQHGVTPAELTEDVGIEIVAADGTSTYFPAAPAGPIGHYVAAVTFPETGGSYAWTVHMGWFGPQELGSIDVAPPSAPAAVVVPSAPAPQAEPVAVGVSSSADSSGSSAWSIARWVLLAAAVVLAGVALADFVSSRRRRGVALG